MASSELFPRMPSRGLWSTTTVRSLQPSTKYRVGHGQDLALDRPIAGFSRMSKAATNQHNLSTRVAAEWFAGRGGLAITVFLQ